MNFEFHIPTKGVVFGAGKIAEAGKLSRQFGTSCLIVCDKFSTKCGLSGKLADIMESAGIKATVYDEVIPNPTVELIDAGAGIARKQKCEFIVGLGGGSSMDSAKGIAVAASHSGSIWAYALGEKPITSQTLPVVTLNTTAGTGSHCTCFSVISNPATHQKPGMGSPYILPSLAIVDPELTVTVPAGMTLVTGFDVLTHAIEAYTSKAASPVSDMCAEKSIALVAANLPRCYKNGNDLEARAGMALADTYSGIAISHAVVTLGHVIAHVIGGHYGDIAHGDALYSVYREVLKFNSAGMKEKHRYVARTLAGTDDIVEAFDKFFKDFKFENKLKSKNLAKKDIDLLAQDTYTYMKGVTDLNCIPNTVEDTRRILTESLR